MQETVEYITGNDFRRMIIGAYQTFVREHEAINSLNVFPVPDGDTGTNMMLTLGAISKAVATAPDQGIDSLSKRAADSAIMGARGNSGVILSQLFRGIARGLTGKQKATSDELGKAFQYGIIYAYRAVATPVEGTILTVAKGIAKGARRAVRGKMPFADILTEAIAGGQTALAQTPELLPALKAAGVVDAGGKGLIAFLNGCLDGLGGGYAGPEGHVDEELHAVPIVKNIDIVHPYCTEFIVKNCRVGTGEAKDYLLTMGESLVLAEGDNLLKVHIHTAHPGAVLENAITWGTLHDIKIDNMADQHRSIIQENFDKKLAVIAVSAGDGLTKIMNKLGADVVIAGGQTMNPPVEAFVEVVYHGSAEHYIILPNNKNIVLAARQAKKLLGERVEIVPTVNIPQGLAALMAYNAEEDMASNVARMADNVAGVHAGSITVAVRDSIVNGYHVTAGDYIGVANKTIVAQAKNVKEALIGLVDTLKTEDSELVSLYYGSEITRKAAEDYKESLEKIFTGLAFELYDGGQPLYPFIISVE